MNPSGQRERWLVVVAAHGEPTITSQDQPCRARHVLKRARLELSRLDDRHAIIDTDTHRRRIRTESQSQLVRPGRILSAEVSRFRTPGGPSTKAVIRRPSRM